MNDNRIYLIGYMGSGKTSIGKLLADKLNMQFIDLDTFIENRYHKKIGTIFEEKGEEEFRRMEERTLNEISSFENVIISTGGGTPCFFENMATMNKSGFTIYLKADEKELAHRLSFGKDKRPLLKGKNRDELESFVGENIKNRESFYMQASFVYDASYSDKKPDINSIVSELVSLITTTKETLL